MKNLDTIVVHTQEDLDNIPYDFGGCIKIKSDPNCVIAIERRPYGVFHIGQNSRVKAQNQLNLWSHDNSIVEIFGHSKIQADGHSFIISHNCSETVAMSRSSVLATQTSRVTLYGEAQAELYDYSTASGTGKSVICHDCSCAITSLACKVRAYEDSTVIVNDYSVQVEAFGNSKIVNRTSEKNNIH